MARSAVKVAETPGYKPARSLRIIADRGLSRCHALDDCQVDGCNSPLNPFDLLRLFRFPLVEFLSRPIQISGRKFSMPRALAIALVLDNHRRHCCRHLCVAPRLASQFPEFSAQARVYWNAVGAKMQAGSSISVLTKCPGRARRNQRGDSARNRKSESDSVQCMSNMAGWLAYLPWLVLIPVLSFLPLKGCRDVSSLSFANAATRDVAWRGDEFFQDVNSTLAAYIRAQLRPVSLSGWSAL